MYFCSDNSPGLGRCKFCLPLHLSGTLCFRSQGSSPAGFSGWNTRPSGHRDLDKILTQLNTDLTASSPLGLAAFTGPVLVALLNIFEEESVVRQLGEGWASGNINILCYHVFIMCLLCVYKLHQYNAQF